eukprot:c16456_g1_i1 orf=152-331(-)
MKQRHEGIVYVNADDVHFTAKQQDHKNSYHYTSTNAQTTLYTITKAANVHIIEVSFELS